MASEPVQPLSSGAKRTLLILSFINLFNYLDRYVLSAVLEPVKEELKLSDGDLGRVATAFMLGYFVTSPFFGFMGDRMSRKKLIAFGVVVWSLGTLLTGFAQTFAMLIAFRTLVGVGEASFGAIGPSVLSDTYSGEKRNRAMTLFFMAVPIGAALGYVIGGQMAAYFGWRHAFYWTGLPGFFMAMLVFFIKDPVRGAADGGTASLAQKPVLKDVLLLFRSSHYVYAVLGYTAYTFAMGAFSYWGPSFLIRVHHLTMQQASAFFGPTLVVGGILGTVIGGSLATRLQRKTPAGYAILLATSVIFSVPLCFWAFLTNDATTSMVASAGAMFFLFLSTGPINTVLVEAVPPQLRSTGMAMAIFCIHAFGDLWSPEIVGRLADHYGGLQKGILILPGAFVFAALFWAILAVKQGAKPTQNAQIALS